MYLPLGVILGLAQKYCLTLLLIKTSYQLLSIYKSYPQTIFQVVNLLAKVTLIVRIILFPRLKLSQYLHLIINTVTASNNQVYFSQSRALISLAIYLVHIKKMNLLSLLRIMTTLAKRVIKFITVQMIMPQGPQHYCSMQSY